MKKAAAFLLVAVVVAPACKPKPPMARIEALRDALVRGEAAGVARATEDLPTCPKDAPAVALAPGQPSPLEKGCLGAIATALGSKKGFVAVPPDQASTATAAALIARDGRGDLVAHTDVWLGSVKSATGAGPDALRLAMADAMAKAAPKIGRPLEEENDLRAALSAVASAVPGACPTYALLGRGSALASLPAELTPEHAACVQHDLARREGPGASYGAGWMRAVEGALAAWRDAERALRMGASHAAPDVARAVEAKLAVIEAATAKIQTKKLAATAPEATLGLMGDLHAQAGVLLWKDAGAGVVDGGIASAADAGIRYVPAPPRLVPVPAEPRRPLP